MELLFWKSKDAVDVLGSIFSAFNVKGVVQAIQDILTAVVLAHTGTALSF